MKRNFILLIPVFLGLLLFYQFRAVLSQNQTRGTATTDSTQFIEIIDLGTLGGENSQASDLNDTGEVIGQSELASEEDIRAFRWFAGAMAPLSATGDLQTNAFGLNEAGVVVGETIAGSGFEETKLPAAWIEDNFASLPIGEFAQGSARAANDAGVIAGHTFEEGSNHLLLWEETLLVETIPVAGGLAQVNGLNDQKQIVGQIHEGSVKKAFAWQEGTFEALGTLGGENSIAYDINDEGWIVGEASTDGELAIHAVLWQEGEVTDLGTIGDGPDATSRALGINEAGVIVGEAQVGDMMHAVVWEDGEIFDLNTLLPAETEWDLLSTAVSINDRGWITGTGLINGKEHAFLLLPESPDFYFYLPFMARPKATPTPTATPTAQPTSTPAPTPTPAPSPTPSTKGYDLARYLQGDGRLFTKCNLRPVNSRPRPAIRPNSTAVVSTTPRATK